MTRSIPCLLILLSVAVPSVCAAGIWYVPSAEAPTIQAGIDRAGAGDTVRVSCGTYRAHRIVMKSGVVLRSETGLADCVLIDADFLDVVLHCDGVDAAARVEGFTLSRGSAGAAYVRASSLTFDNCVFTENQASGNGGGAVYCFSASPVFTHCTFARNQAGYHGGGLYCYGSTVRLTDCLFSENVANQDGGGLRSLDSHVVLTFCTFVNNHAEDGGAVYAASSDLFLTRCLVRSNSAGGGGGGLFCYDTSPVIGGCTFAHNGAGYAGGLCFSQQSEAVIKNTIVAFNDPGRAVVCLDPESAPTLSCCDVFGNPFGDWTGCIAGQLGVTGNFSQDPAFCAPWDGDYSLSLNSPCAPDQSPAGCGLVGAGEPACDFASTALAETSSPGALELGAIVPNPFNPSTVITYTVPRSGLAPRVTLEVYNALGERVRILPDGPCTAGTHQVTWDGMDEGGSPVASGVYFCRIKWNGRSETRRMILIR